MENLKNSTLQEYDTLTETEMLDIFGGGGLSDLIVKGLTYVGDHAYFGPYGNPCWK
jgi:hypothetical protein